MAYVLGTNFDPRFTFPTAQRDDARSAGSPAPRMDDEDDAWSRQAYINHVYGGLVSNRPDIQKAISDQYEYNKRRLLSGKDVLKIADVKWDPTAYDDEMNEWMGQQYQKSGKLPSGEERLYHFQELHTKKWREAFEVPASIQQSTQTGNGNPSIYLANEDQRRIDQNQHNLLGPHSAANPLPIPPAGNWASQQPTTYGAVPRRQDCQDGQAGL